ncbi:MAG: hypothetical protein IPJ71_04570 [Bdellovibrionales bacterium]|nr:hypothetical protein [Bdellovibrionales bacterium]
MEIIIRLLGCLKAKEFCHYLTNFVFIIQAMTIIVSHFAYAEIDPPVSTCQGILSNHGKRIFSDLGIDQKSSLVEKLRKLKSEYLVKQKNEFNNKMNHFNWMFHRLIFKEESITINGITYLIIQPLGAGTEGNVFWVEHEGSQFVLKIYNPGKELSKGLTQQIKEFNDKKVPSPRVEIVEYQKEGDLILLSEPIVIPVQFLLDSEKLNSEEKELVNQGYLDFIKRQGIDGSVRKINVGLDIDSLNFLVFDFG